jgi:hypothetical protein
VAIIIPNECSGPDRRPEYLMRTIGFQPGRRNRLARYEPLCGRSYLLAHEDAQQSKKGDHRRGR